MFKERIDATVIEKLHHQNCWFGNLVLQ
ncbi:hypothetical protein [Terrimonas alba]